jgi:hypothetical protein
MILEAVKAFVLLLSVAIVLVIWSASGAAAYQAVMSPEFAFTTPSYEGFLDWLANTWYAFVIFAKIAFWVIVALLGTFIVLLIAVVLGVGSWLIQRVTQGIAYLVGVIKGQWASTPIPPDKMKITVAFRMDGSEVSLQEWMAEAHATIAEMDTRLNVVERINGTV